MSSNLRLTSLKPQKVKKNYIKQVQAELKKVSWTSKQELILCTKIVLISTFTMGLAIYLADICIKNALNLISYIARLIFG